jgi:limonene-1,2-epoxide hydrolase
MHSNADVIRRLYTAIDNADPDAIMACYADDPADDAYFEDIAFQRRGRKEIHQMWRMVCHAKPNVKILSATADDQKGSGSWEADYMFGKTESATNTDANPGRHVINIIASTFTFRDGRIVRHSDHCDAMAWARQAFPFPLSVAMGLIGPLRRGGAALKLNKFLRAHPR